MVFHFSVACIAIDLIIHAAFDSIGEIRVRIMRLQSRNRPIEQEKMLLNKFIREGIAYIQFLLRKCEDYHVLRISLMGYLGDLHRYKGDYAGAEKLYNDVIKLGTFL